MTQTAEAIKTLIEDCGGDFSAPPDAALLRSMVFAIEDPLVFSDLLEEHIDCLPLVSVVHDVYREGRLAWPWEALQRLCESLLANGFTREAGQVAEHLRSMRPTSAYAARLWAYAASNPEETVRRFVLSLSQVSDPVTLESDAREFVVRSVEPELGSLLERLLSESGR